VYRNSKVCNVCLVTLAVSFALELYPGGPTHNTAFAVSLLWAANNIDDVRPLRRRGFFYALSLLGLLTLCMDLDFLASDLKVCQ
ncbi:unnamed protein product, partial [Choristocarpus tenellus]